MRERVQRAAAVAICAASMGVLGALSWPYAADDTFILFRYGRHLAGGLGLVWNPGEPPVEGYTNLLYVALSAGLERFGFTPLLAVKLLGVAAWVLLVPLTARLAEALGADGLESRLAACAVALSPGLAFWAVAGLETAPFALLLTFAAVCFTQDSPRGDWAAAIALFGAALMRTEAPAFALVLACARLAADWRASPRRLLPWVLGFGVPWGVFFAARALYFHAALPNPVLFKSHFAPGAGPSVWWPFLAAWGPLCAFALVGAVARGRARLPALLLALTAVPVYAFASDLVYGSTTMGFFDRYLLPVVPCVAVLGAVPLAALIRARGLPRWAGIGLSVALGAWIFWNPSVGPRRIGTLAISQKEGVSPSIAALADFLSAERPPSYRVAIGDVGDFGFRFHGHVDDLFGLNEAEYTHRCHNELGCWKDAVLGRSPDGVVLVMLGDQAAHEVERRLLADPAFTGRWRRAREFRSGINPWAYVLFERSP